MNHTCCLTRRSTTYVRTKRWSNGLHVFTSNHPFLCMSEALVQACRAPSSQIISLVGASEPYSQLWLESEFLYIPALTLPDPLCGPAACAIIPPANGRRVLQDDNAAGQGHLETKRRHLLLRAPGGVIRPGRGDWIGDAGNSTGQRGHL